MTQTPSGDGHASALPALADVAPPTLPARRAYTIVVHSSPVEHMVAELRRQTSLQEQHARLQERTNELLHRSLLGDVDQLDAADVMVALKVGRTKLGELVDDGELPMYRLPAEGRGEATGPRRIARDTLRAVIRRWAEGRR